MDKRGLVAVAAAALGAALLLSGCVGPDSNAQSTAGDGSTSTSPPAAETDGPTGTATPGATGAPATDAAAPAPAEPEPLTGAEQQGEQSDPGGVETGLPDDNPAVAQTRFLDAVRPAWSGETPSDDRLLELAGSACQQLAAGSAVEQVVAVVGETDGDLANNALVVQQATAIVCPA